MPHDIELLDRPASSISPAPAGAAPPWRFPGAPPHYGARRIKLAGAWFALIGVATLLVWASSWLRPPRPACLSLVGAAYQDNLVVPHNVAGWRTLGDLAELTRDEGLFSFWGRELLRLRHEPIELRTDTAWDGGLDDFDEPTLLIYFAAHGAADAEGPYLLPHDTNGDDDGTNRLRVADVIRRLGQLPADKHKVLILDAVHWSANWRLGVVHNDFARQVVALEPQIAAVPGLTVILSSGLDQRCWPAEPWGRTAMGHFVMEGLRGAVRDTNRDGRVDLAELFSYLATEVEQYVDAYALARQTPLLLPSGAEGPRRAARVDLGVVRSGYRPQPAAAVAALAPLDERGQAWRNQQQLAATSPPPTAFAPQLWRLYLDTLLRAEQLAEAGDDAAAAQLQIPLRAQEVEIERRRTLQLISLTNNLAMPSVAGVAAGPQDQAEQALSALWQADAAHQDVIWRKALAAVPDDGSAHSLFRLAFGRLLYDRVHEDPLRNLAPAAQLLLTTRDPIRPRPTELHWLLMLNRYLAADATSSDDDATLRLAIEVRRLAEQTAAVGGDDGRSRGERLVPWVIAQVEAADDLRRKGEDLLFGSQPDRRRAQALLAQARDQYLAARDLAATVHEALRARDEALATLPYYSQWLAGSPQRLRPAASDAIDLAQLERLWQEVHQLTDALQTPGPAAQAKDPRATAEALAEQTELVQSGVAATSDAFLTWCRHLADLDVPAAGFEAELALKVPYIEPGLRLKLLQRWRQARRAPATTRPEARSGLASITAAQNQQRAQSAAQAQGRLALAVLGRTWFDAEAHSLDTHFEQVQHRLDVFQVEERWWSTLTAAGEAIGLRWRRMGPTIDNLVRGSADLARAPAVDALGRADRLARCIDGAGAATLGTDPTSSERGLLVQGLLIWLADRTWQDHWYAEDLGAEPYFRVAALLYLDDAQRLAPQVAEVAQARQKVLAPSGLVLGGQDLLPLTSQQQATVHYTLAPADNTTCPPGTPLVWLHGGASLSLREPAAGARVATPLAPQGPAVSFRAIIGSPALEAAEYQPPGALEVERTELEATAFFRGQLVRLSTDVELHLVPQMTVVRHPPPPRAAVAVEAPDSLHRQFGDGSGAVAIVLDCSGSMGPPAGESFGPTTKYAEATAALRSVLAALPPGTMLSLWTFGQAMGTQRTVPEAERTVQQVRPPTTWRATPSEVEALIEQVSHPQLVPWNESPIVRAMLAAKADLDSAAGFKTLVVITDGMDNRFASDAEMNARRQDVAAALRTNFDNSGIVVNVVGFKVVGSEQETARRQFEVVESFFPPGRFFRVDQADALSAALGSALAQRLRFWVVDYAGNPVSGLPAAGCDVSRASANQQWFAALTAGSYRLRTHAAQPIERPIELAGGDHLLLALEASGLSLNLRRVRLLETLTTLRPTQAVAGWDLTLLENRLVDHQSAEWLLAVEPPAGGDRARLCVVRPDAIWLEVAPSTASDKLAVRWYPTSGYIAPTWKIAASGWPVEPQTGAACRPIVRAWWSADGPPPAAAHLRRGHDFTSIDELAGDSIQIVDDTVTIESVSVETHVVETAAGQRSEQPCLVVRVNHALDRPLAVRLTGLAAAGEEHRYYTDTAQYTALFWPVTPHAASQLDGLSFVSLNEWKRAVEQRQWSVDWNNLERPSAGDLPPPVQVNLQTAGSP